MASQQTRGRDRGVACAHCGVWIDLRAAGTKNRNHCPRCLWSRHVDERIGDRRSACNQPMEPIAITARTDGEWSLVHRCTGCGQLRLNRIAGDDDELQLLGLALRPLATPAFPLDRLPMR